MRRLFSLVAIALPAFVACSSAPTPDDAVQPAPSPAATSGATEIARQTVEIEPGHSVTVIRYSDESMAVAEVGTIGEHTPAIDRRAVGRSARGILRLAVPGVEPSDSMLSAPLPPSPANLVPIPSPPLPKTSFVPVVANLPPSPVATAILSCASTKDLPPSNCQQSFRGGMTLPPDYGGWYRAFAFNEGSTAAATLTALAFSGSGYSVMSSISLGPNQWGELQVLSATQQWMMAELSEGTKTSVLGLSSFVATIAPRAQEFYNSCWATSSQMVMASYGTDLNQCSIMSTHFGLDCCASPLPATSICGSVGASGQGEGEAWQALHENGFAFSMLGSTVNDPVLLGAALQDGPMTVHQPQHYTVLTDYREVQTAGAPVPYALKVNPEPENDLDTTDHTSFIPLSSVGAIENPSQGYADDAQADVHAGNRTNLVVAIPRITWKSATGVATGFFDAPGATSYNVQWTDLNNKLYTSGTVTVPSTAIAGSTATATFAVGAWIWYRLHVQACSGGTCGAWATRDGVSLLPSTTINSLSAANGTLSATFTGNPWPEHYNYQCMSGLGTNPPVRYAHITAVTPAVETTPVAEIVTCQVPTGTIGGFMVQACNDNGCGPWASLWTGT